MSLFEVARPETSCCDSSFNGFCGRSMQWFILFINLILSTVIRSGYYSLWYDRVMTKPEGGKVIESDR